MNLDWLLDKDYIFHWVPYYFLLESQNEPIVGHVNENGSVWFSYVVLPQ